MLNMPTKNGSWRCPAEVANQLSGHSLRIGAAQDLMSGGRDVVAIMKAGGWRSINVVARYIEAA